MTTTKEIKVKRAVAIKKKVKKVPAMIQNMNEVVLSKQANGMKSPLSVNNK